MHSHIEKRVLDIATYILKNCSTVRATAKIFKVSKSTVHNDLRKRLPKLDKKMHKDICKLLKINFEQKHLRGGQSTKEKYLKLSTI